MMIYDKPSTLGLAIVYVMMTTSKLGIRGVTLLCIHVLNSHFLFFVIILNL